MIPLAGLFVVLIGGLLGDRFGVKRTLGTLCLLAGVAGALRGAVRQFYQPSDHHVPVWRAECEYTHQCAQGRQHMVPGAAAGAGKWHTITGHGARAYGGGND